MNRFRNITDQMGRQLRVPLHPRRIISLVPSQTELLFYLGQNENIVGITKFCIHPEEQFRKKTKVGGTKQLKPDLIAQLKPDLIIANKEENERSQIEMLEQKYPVWISNIYTLKDALEMIVQIGRLVNRESKGMELVTKIEKEFSYLEQTKICPKVAYFIWRKPWMVAGRNTFINHLLQRAGFKNVFESLQRYPEIESAQLEKAAPDVILLSSEPYPFKDKHRKEIQELCPKAVIILVDGELFTWYGNRLLQSATYFCNLQLQIENELNDGLEK